MLILPRSAVRAFRNVFRKCSGGRSRPHAQPALLHAENGRIALLASTPEVTVQLIVPQAESQGSFVMAINVLESFEGSAESVKIGSKGRGKALARWTDRGLPKELAIDLLPPSRVSGHWPVPDVWSEASEELLQAMHEAGKSTTRDTGRYSLQRIQVNGSQGKICGTDGNQALIHGGFQFPFPETVHLPAVPVFGAKEFAGLAVRIGRTETHCVFEIGPWTLWLSIDPSARFPDLDAVVPQRKNATTIAVSETDAAFLLDLLPQFPGHDDEDASITIAVRNSLIAVRGQGVKDAKPAEVFLTGSTTTGPPIRVAIKRRFLIRALSLGMRQLRWAVNANAFVAADDHQLFLCSVLDPSMCLGPQDTPPAKVMMPSSPQETTMPKPNPESESVPPDLLAEAESLRNAIYDVGQRISRIITILKSKKKDERTLNQVFTSLKSLQLGGPPR